MNGIPPLPSSRQGAALIICLSLIIVVCIALVGFVTTARVERQTANAHLSAQTAAFYAGISTDIVRARILQAVSDGTAANHRWASGPGRIAVVDLAATPPEERIVPLYSGEVAASSATQNLSINLNPASLTQGRGIVMDDIADVLPQQWIYVREDGTHEIAASIPAYDKDNPVLGRYAFWTDDLSARLNWNTASSRASSASQPLGHPSRVDLTALESISDADTEELNLERTSQGFFNTPDEIKRMSDTAPALAAAATDRSFEFTHFNHAPSGNNIFGSPRLALTTKAANVEAGDPNFLDILTTPTADPGALSNTNDAKVQALFQKLYTDLSRKDWPQQPGVSFVDKYGAHNAAQIIINLIDYVRSAESTDLIVEPLRGEFNATTGVFTRNANSSVNALVGNSRRPVITELGIEVPQNPQTVNAGTPEEKQAYACQVHVEIYWPENAGGTLDLVNDCTLHLGAIDNPAKTASEGTIPAGRVQGSPIMNPGEYRVVIWPMSADADLSGAPPSPMYLRAVISKRRPGTTQSGARLDVVPPVTGIGNVLEYIPARGVPANNIASLSTDDPFVNRHRNDWKSGTNTFGAANSGTLGAATSTVPPQDVNASGVIVNTNVELPSRNQPLQSLGAIGQIHTGIRGKVAGAGTPWRTIRLYPDATADVLPDWVLLDLFRISGQGLSNTAIYPLRDASGRIIAKGGLVNLNTDLQPFASGSDPKRLIPLTAVFKGASNGSGAVLSQTDAETLVDHINSETLATGGRRYGPAGTYLYPGEVVEVRGVADQGESRETLVGQVIDLLTTQSNTFAVYSVGQSVRQSATGTISVTAEKRTLTFLELAEDSVRVVYQQDLGL